MTPALHEHVLEKLIAEEVDSDVAGIVDAACDGAEQLEAALAQLGGSEVRKVEPTSHRTKALPPGVYLKELELEGFRGIGPKQKVQLEPGPGLTLLVGRNGSGKSSFAEGLETLLTATCRRWDARPKEWMSGWRNLHSEAGAFVEGTFMVEGSEPIVVRRIWPDGTELEDAELRVRRGSERLGTLADLGWEDPLVTFRPFLSYSELGAVVAVPSKLYDELKSILGLEEVTAATKRLGEARKRRKSNKDALADKTKKILQKLEDLDDPRAETCREQLCKKRADLDAIEAAALRDGTEDQEESVVTRLRRIAQLTCPALDDVAAAASAVRDAVAEQAKVAGTSMEQSAALSGLLKQALHFHSEFGGPCPVCETALGDEWSVRAQARLEEAKQHAAEAERVAKAVRDQVHALRRLIGPVPPALLNVEETGLSTDALRAWQRWAAAPDDTNELCNHAESAIVDLSDAVSKLRTAAEEKLSTMESTWRPLARELAVWLHDARGVETEAPALSALKKAEKWMKEAEMDLQNERFEPIAERAQKVWSLLRQESSVDLASVRLEGTATRRRVTLDVSVDGKEGVAVGVMSQGELNALALSLFLPRVTVDESPFHFVVVDDPVQAMDPHKVDGLAQVLDEVARTRQVIVLTHDTRLTEAVDRLGIQAQVLEVSRRAQSVVEVQTAVNPVERHLRDARSCMRDAPRLGPGVAERTVPVFCRLAIEAACVVAIRRRRLGRGDRHADVENAIAGCRGLHPLAALAIEDDDKAGDRVYEFLNNKCGQRQTHAFRAIKASSHAGYNGSLEDLVADARRLAHALRERR